MEDKTIDFYSFEEITSRMERTNVRLWIMCIILILALICTNFGWVYYENQFTDTTEIAQEIDTENGNATVTGIGDITYGEDKADNH